VIIPNSHQAVLGVPIDANPVYDPYVFCFKNISGGLPGQRACSDSTSTLPGVVEVLVLQNNVDLTKFALLFDDGGAGPDRDFSDFVVTAQGDVGQVGSVCELQFEIAEAIAALKSGDKEVAVDALEAARDIILLDPNFPFPEDGPFTTELLGRIFSVLFDLGEPQRDGHDHQ
jgi:hypothetical protein